MPSGSRYRHAKRARSVERSAVACNSPISRILNSNCTGIVWLIRSYLGVYSNCQQDLLRLYRSTLEICLHASDTFLSIIHSVDLQARFFHDRALSNIQPAPLESLFDNSMQGLLYVLRDVVSSVLLDTPDTQSVASRTYRDWVSTSFSSDPVHALMLIDRDPLWRIFAALRLCWFPPMSGYFYTSYCTVFQTLERQRTLKSLRQLLHWCHFLHDAFAARFSTPNVDNLCLVLRKAACLCLRETFPYAY